MKLYAILWSGLKIYCTKNSHILGWNGSGISRNAPRSTSFFKPPPHSPPFPELGFCFRSLNFPCLSPSGRYVTITAVKWTIFSFRSYSILTKAEGKLLKRVQYFEHDMQFFQSLLLKTQSNRTRETLRIRETFWSVSVSASHRRSKYPHKHMYSPDLKSQLVKRTSLWGKLITWSGGLGGSQSFDW